MYIEAHTERLTLLLLRAEFLARSPRRHKPVDINDPHVRHRSSSSSDSSSTRGRRGDKLTRQ